MLSAGRVEFTTFLPENTQAVVVQPIGNDGVLIAASNTQRGFTRLDQVKIDGMTINNCSRAELASPAWPQKLNRQFVVLQQPYLLLPAGVGSHTC